MGSNFFSKSFVVFFLLKIGVDLCRLTPGDIFSWNVRFYLKKKNCETYFKTLSAEFVNPGPAVLGYAAFVGNVDTDKLASHSYR